MEKHSIVVIRPYHSQSYASPIAYDKAIYHQLGRDLPNHAAPITATAVVGCAGPRCGAVHVALPIHRHIAEWELSIRDAHELVDIGATPCAVKTLHQPEDGAASVAVAGKVCVFYGRAEKASVVLHQETGCGAASVPEVASEVVEDAAGPA